MIAGAETNKGFDRSGVDTSEETLKPDDVRALIHEGLATASSGEIVWGNEISYSNSFGSETLTVTGLPRKARQGETVVHITSVRDQTTFQVNSGRLYPPARISNVAVGKFGGIKYSDEEPITLERGREIIAGLRSKPTP